ncbi:MAG TPA: hypothetical protein VFQ80_13385 [Thermomicrobiales bacterium]|nr:hypothetical protein [Thermomicrobiales bacterium]
MVDRVPARFQIGVEFEPGLVARLADAETFVLAQAHLIAFAALLRAGDWRGTLVIVRHADAAVLERRILIGIPGA